MSGQEAATNPLTTSHDEQQQLAVNNNPKLSSSPLATDSSMPVLSIDTFPSDCWDQTTDYPAISAPLQRVGDLRRRLTGVLLNRPKVKCIYPCPHDSSGRRLLVLDPTKHSVDAPHALVQTLLANDASLEMTSYTITLSYKDFTVDEIFRRILPNDTELPSAFEQVGPICHVNLRHELMPYKYWIGKVLLDKNAPSIQTVVTKLGNIDTEFRTFAMQVVAGNDTPGWSIVTLKEEGCTFQLDFQRVYWNSRLAGEHRRMVELLQKQAAAASLANHKRPLVVADLMAGIGPFAVPLTATMRHHKRIAQTSPTARLHVYANDLNPASFEYLHINAAKNKCQHLECFNLDARQMVHKLQDDGVVVDHFLMNLPKIAPEFLDAFRGYINKSCDTDPHHYRPPTIHVYCFAPKASEDQKYPEALERCRQALGCGIDADEHVVSIRTIRNIAPTKNMVCVSFVLPRAASELKRIVLDQPIIDQESANSNGDIDEPGPKRCKTDND